MRTWLPLLGFLFLFLACEADDSDASLLETEYVRYETTQPFTPCGGLARDTDRKVEQLYDRLEEPYPPPNHILYKWVADDSTLVCVPNAAGCTRLGEEGPIIASLYLAEFHELAHAAQFSVLGYTHVFLSEGFATYYTGRYDELSPEGMSTFESDIESLIVSGSLAGLQYPLAAHFVGATIERHGLDAFKDFWRLVAPKSTLEEFRTVYEAHYDETWSEALTAIVNHKQSTWLDLECEGEAQVVGVEGIHLAVTETCGDENVVGPMRNGEGHAGELRIPVELPAEGLYRFTFAHAELADEPAAVFRGCQGDGPAPNTPLTLFFPGDDHPALLGSGRYLLTIRVPLTTGEPPIKASIVPEG